MNILKILAIISFTVAGCTADLSYRKLGESWASGVGYSDFEIGSNKYKVMYTGGVDNPPSTVMKYAYHRAKDLCAEKGFNDYVATNTESGNRQTSSHAVPNIIRPDFDTKSQTSYSLDVECKNK
jgi:hypothetical protein